MSEASSTRRRPTPPPPTCGSRRRRGRCGGCRPGSSSGSGTCVRAGWERCRWSHKRAGSASAAAAEVDGAGGSSPWRRRRPRLGRPTPQDIRRHVFSPPSRVLRSMQTREGRERTWWRLESET
ncbi:hypothetical protein NL676_001642 [Syzygium grande]|nr:hypothetical protein NL676_001642 [Syzygium grande]